jgi:hypothetical protein
MINLEDYKKEIMMALVKNPDIVDLIDSKSSGYTQGKPDTLIYNNIFPYLRIPETVNIVDTYILLAVDIAGISRYNPTFATYVTTVWCMAHQDRMKVDDRNGTRIDLLSGEVKKMFDGRLNFGFSEFEMISSREVILNEKFQYREMRFECKDQRHKVNPAGKAVRRGN